MTERSVETTLSSLVVALFAVAFLRVPRAVRLANPLVTHLFGTGIPAGPNVLLTVRGRRTGKPRTVPVALLELGERWILQAAFGEVSWVINLRAAREATIQKGHTVETVEAVELAHEEAGRLFQEALAPYPRSDLLRAVLGPTERPPVGVLHYFGIRVDTTLDEYIAEARRHPVFELRPQRARAVDQTTVSDP